MEYFLALVAMPLPQLADFPQDKFEACRDIHLNFNEADARWVKDKGRIFNHDVKAVEYFVKDAMERLGVGAWKEFVHFGLTSKHEQHGHSAVPKRATEQAVMPLLDTLVADLVYTWKSVPMLARTHGQPASPVTLRKEIQSLWIAFVDSEVLGFGHVTKFGGATGQFNAHHVAYPAWTGHDLDVNLWRGALV